MATATISPDQNAVHAEIFIAAPPERVFQALTDPAQTPRWWGQEGLYRVTESKADLRPGGKWSSDGVGADGTKFRVEGEYLEIDPPRLLVHTWISTYSGALKTIVRWNWNRPASTGCIPRAPSEPAPARWSKCIRKDSLALRNRPSAMQRAGSASSAGCTLFCRRALNKIKKY